MTRLLPLAALAALTLSQPALAQASAAIASGQVAPSALSPGEIVAAAPKSEWVAIAASDLLVMDLAPDAKARPRRVVIQLIPPPFSAGWVGNIRKLAAAHWWDGLSINRVQDNYVVQWGDADGEDKAKARALPAGLATVPEGEYEVDKPAIKDFWVAITGKGDRSIVGPVISPADRPRSRIADPYASYFAFAAGIPLGLTLTMGEEERTVPSGKSYKFAIGTPERAWPVHCYGMVGVGRDLSPNTGSGTELYTVIGHAPRHLDRNIALVGRVIEGMEHLSSLPRGTGALGFYETPEERTKIASIRLGNEVPDLPAYEYLSTEGATFARYADARANRRDPFFIKPAGGADICNIPVPVRRAK